MASRSVLISGAGIAGPTLAYWLARHGFQPTIVERSRGLRSSGNPVDVRGPALPVAKAMGIMARLRDAATQTTAMSVLNTAGRPVARLGTATTRNAANQQVELPRGDLASALYEVTRNDAEFLFDDTIIAMRQDNQSVEVSFDRAAPRRFDLAVGTDGLHSTVRRLAFGPERDFVRHLGVYIATMPLGDPVDHPHDILMYNTPGRLVTIHPSRGDALVAFIFRSAEIPGFDYRDTQQHQRIVTDAYAGVGWRVPELVKRFQTADDLYFDSVSQVRLPAWTRGRIALLGDAASCVSLFGDGSSLAMAGAFTLASALAADPADHAKAFDRYESQHRTLVDPKQRDVRRTMALLIPKTRFGVAARNLAARLWLSRR